MTYQIVSDYVPIIPYQLFYTKQNDLSSNKINLKYTIILSSWLKAIKVDLKILPLSNELETFLYFFILHATMLDDW